MTDNPGNRSNTPTGGQVQFYATNQQGTQTLLGTETLTESGTATLSTTALSAGSEVLTATYTGTSAYAGTTTSSTPQSDINTVVGGSDGGPPTGVVSNPQGVAVDSAGDIFIADTGHDEVREVNKNGVLTTVAGDGVTGYTGDRGPATAAELSDPTAIALDALGDILIADTGNNVIREVVESSSAATALGVAIGDIVTVVGSYYSGNGRYSGDGGAATAAVLSGPMGVAVDSSGNIFISDTGNNRVREVAESSSAAKALGVGVGDIVTVAGNGTAGSSGDGGPGSQGELNRPEGVAVDFEDDIFIADTGNNVVREVYQGAKIYLFAGDYTAGFNGASGAPSQIELSGPEGVAVDPNYPNYVYIADTGNSLIRKVNPYSNTTITTVAGSGTSGYAGDGGLATAAQLNGPVGIAAGGNGDFFIADSVNNRVREVASVTGTQDVSIQKAALTVTATPESKLYGSLVPALTYQIAGFVNGDNMSAVSGAPMLTTAATLASGVGSYPIAIGLGSLASNDYSFTQSNLIGSTFSITPAPLTISVTSVSRYAGQDNPALTVLYSGFVNGDTPASLAAQPDVTTAATAASGPGTYPLILGGAFSPNYTINYVNGTLTVIAAPVTVESVSVQKITVGRHKTEQVIVLDFSGDLSPGAAGNAGNYSLATVAKAKKKSKRVALSRAAYNDAPNTVTLMTAKKLALSPPLLLTINAAGLLDAEGRPLDGNGDGQPGGNFVATLSTGRVTIDSAVVLGERSLRGGLVDAVLEAGFRAKVDRSIER